MPFKNYRVIQIMPAGPDWRAVFADEREEGLVIETQLVGWALVEDGDGARSVVGFDAAGEAESCEALENFLGYAAPGETSSRWHRDAVRYFRERVRGRPAGHGEHAAALDLVRRLFRAIEERDWDAVAACYHPAATYRDPEVEVEGRDAIRARALALEAPFSGATFTIASAVPGPDGVAVSWDYAAENTGRLFLPGGLDLPATGARVRLHGASLFALDEGLIRSQETFWDGLALYHQLGVVSDPRVQGSW